MKLPLGHSGDASRLSLCTASRAMYKCFLPGLASVAYRVRIGTSGLIGIRFKAKRSWIYQAIKHNGPSEMVEHTLQLAHSGAPPCNFGVAAQTCDFDSGSCGWAASAVPSSGAFYWTRLNYGSPTPGTGPSADHTTGIQYRGYYFHTDASYGVQGEQAWLTSPTVDASVDQNFTFWYNMYGNRLTGGMGQLQLFLVPTGGTLGDDGLLWVKDGNQGDRWIHASVVIPQQSAYNLVFVGTRGSSIAGDIALDDIVIADADTPDTALQYDCDFEHETSDLCGYVQDETDQLQWTRQQGGTPSAGTGPSADHTLGTDAGHYMYMETSSDGVPLSEGDAARLLSPRYPPTTSMCLTFFYHMYGANIGSLRVYVKQTGTLTLTWSKSGSLGDMWYMAIAPLVTDDEFQIVFEAARGNGAFGDIAIDDVAIVNGSCPVPSVTPAQTTVPTTAATTTSTITPLATTTTPLAAVTTQFTEASTSPSPTPPAAATTGANETSVLGRVDNGKDAISGTGLVAGVCVAVLFWAVVYVVVVHFIRKKRRKQRQERKEKGHFDVVYDPTCDDVSTRWKDDDDDDGGPGMKCAPDLQDMTHRNGTDATKVDVDIETDVDAQLEADVTPDHDPPIYVNRDIEVTPENSEPLMNSSKEADETADIDRNPNVIDSASKESLISLRSDPDIIFLEPSDADDGPDSVICVPCYKELAEHASVV
ncbi:MAM and LDL-receptor class A domain-containing protein 2-like isoform X4 [Branchiostoma floridae x Branchiostoma belcheri]